MLTREAKPSSRSGLDDPGVPASPEGPPIPASPRFPARRAPCSSAGRRATAGERVLDFRSRALRPTRAGPRPRRVAPASQLFSPCRRSFARTARARSPARSYRRDRTHRPTPARSTPGGLSADLLHQPQNRSSSVRSADGNDVVDGRPSRAGRRDAPPPGTGTHSDSARYASRRRTASPPGPSVEGEDILVSGPVDEFPEFLARLELRDLFAAPPSGTAWVASVRLRGAAPEAAKPRSSILSPVCRLDDGGETASTNHLECLRVGPTPGDGLHISAVVCSPDPHEAARPPGRSPQVLRRPRRAGRPAHPRGTTTIVRSPLSPCPREGVAERQLVAAGLPRYVSCPA